MLLMSKYNLGGFSLEKIGFFALRLGAKNWSITWSSSSGPGGKLKEEMMTLLIVEWEKFLKSWNWVWRIKV